MQRAWLALLIGSLGCGFNASSARSGGGDDAGGSGSDGGTMVDAQIVETCWKLNDVSDGTSWSACIKQSPGAAIDIAANTVINTDDQTSQPTGLKCVVISTTVKGSGPVEICALFATSIKIDAGVTLSAQGQLPLALFASTIDVEGTIDVASHKSTRGPASNVEGCNPSNPSKGGGGGAGGTWAIGSGGAGGDQGNVSNSGGVRGSGISATTLRGGCDGRRGGDGSPTGGPDGSGGAAGGAVWLATNGGKITLGPTSVIDASGSGGAGGASVNHGGSGGGSGGLIVLSSTTIAQDAASQIFANGGGGGGGGDAASAGGDGGDPMMVHSTGSSGDGAGMGNGGGAGGQGYPASSTIAGASGNPGMMAGGGGGGGGAGLVRVDTKSTVINTQFSPAPKFASN